MTAAVPKVRVENLYKIYGTKTDDALKRVRAGQSRQQILEETGNISAVEDVSFTVEQGKIFVVMGLSGSGKSTLIRCLNRLIEPTAGKVYFEDVDVTGADEEGLRNLRRNKMAMVFQHFALFPHKTVSANIEYGLKVRGGEPRKIRKRAHEVLDQVGLLPWADKYPGELSGGMQQRVGLARGLAVDPEILLMDEAFSALDPLIRREMQNELLHLQEQLRKTIIFITHDLSEALLLGDQIAIMKDGRFVQVGTPFEIVSEPADDYVASFTGDVDRSRIYKVRDVLRKTVALQKDQTVSQALEQLRGSPGKIAYVTDCAGEFIGISNIADLRAAEPGNKISALLLSKATRLRDDMFIYETYSFFKDRQELAVISGEGKLLGKALAKDIFEMLAKGAADE